MIQRMDEKPAYRWREPTWRQAAESWIRQSAARLGMEVTGPVEGVRFLPWSAVLRAPTPAGDLFFKACGPSQRHEPALAAFLATLHPEWVIPVLATDLQQGWLLMPDGGLTLTPFIRTPDDGPDHWRRILHGMGSLQRDLIPHVPHLLALGVPDRRPVELPPLLDSLLQRPERLLAGEPGALAWDDVRRLSRLRPRVAELCAELSELGPPACYVQDDFHEDHIFPRQDQHGKWHYRVFDFGDACIAHPFFQLVSQPRFFPNRYADVDHPFKISLYEVYLDVWDTCALRPSLRRARRIAHALGGIMRAMTWINACGESTDELLPDLRQYYKEGVSYWLGQVAIRTEELQRN